VATPIWDKSEAQDVSMYDSTPYKDPLAAFGKLMVEDGRSGHSAEHIGRYAYAPCKRQMQVARTSMHDQLCQTAGAAY